MLSKEEINELETYLELDTSSVGDTANLLLELYYNRDGLSGKFVDALEDEIKENLDMYVSSTTIVMREKTITTTVRELDWGD